MKQFFKTVLAVIVAMLLMNIVNLIFFLFFFILVGLSGLSGSSSVSVKPDSVLLIDMSKIALGEQTQESNPFQVSYSSDAVPTIGIWDATMALQKAAKDPAISYLCLLTDGASGGIATMEEFRKAIVDFHSSGKPVIAYIENTGNAGYYLASAADKIYMTSAHGTMSSLLGLSSQIVFLKDLLDKLGVNVQLIRHGKFKSAGEMYIRNDISAENRLQYETFLNSIWGGWAEEIAASRNITPDRFNALLDNLELNSPEDFVNASLVDELVDLDEFRQKMAEYAGKISYKRLDSVNFYDYVSGNDFTNASAKSKIAVIYADGEIVDGKDVKGVAGDRFEKIISDIEKDRDVKAVVLRVNSPGGSVLASDKIKVALDRLGESKPIVASYCNYAASGGYWISNNCRRIFCDKGTLTGSIGCFSMIPDFSNTVKNLAHVNIVTINSNKHSDMLGVTRALTADEFEYMQASVEDIYARFVSTVSQGRNMSEDYVDSIAQGRVWAGSDALTIGLVDEIGTLEDAVRYAASLIDDEQSSSLSNYRIAAYPEPISPLSQLIMFITGEDEDIFAGTAFESVSAAYRDFSAQCGGQVFARMPYVLTIE